MLLLKYGNFQPAIPVISVLATGNLISFQYRKPVLELEINLGNPGEPFKQ
jgi:hypothetical protein